jgi:Leucine-rich repeat (LRR) protein
MDSWIQEEFESIRDSAFDTPVLRMNRKNITKLDWIPTRCEELQFQENYLKRLPQLSNTVTKLNVSKNQLESLPELLPQRLLYLNVSDNPDLHTLPSLPEGLEVLIASNCGLIECPVLPRSLKFLYLQNNYLKELPQLPANLDTLYIFKNCIEDLTGLPKTLSKCLADPQNT